MAHKLIQTEGSLIIDGTTYVDPYIDIYYLSYNGVAPIYAFPQIVTSTQGVLAQLLMLQFNNNPMTTTREDLLNLTIGELSILFPHCIFKLVTI